MARCAIYSVRNALNKMIRPARVRHVGDGDPADLDAPCGMVGELRGGCWYPQKAQQREASPMRRNRLTIAGVAAGIVFAVGFVMVIMVPGLGGTSTTKDFTDFYGSGGKRGAASLLGFVLVIGCWLMVWLFAELRASFTNSVRADVAYRLGVIAAAAVMIGAAVELAPTMAQNGSDNTDFVGVPIAHTFAQAGAGAVIIGLFTFAAAVLLCGLEFRRATAFPRWLGTLSIVFAILLIGSFFALPGFLLPIWAIVVGIAGRGGNAPAVPASS